MSIENLLDKLNEAFEAKKEEQIAELRYTGFDWGYHGFQWSERRRIANNNFEEALNDYIKKVIEKNLEEKK